jgi:hypothetical protein
MLLPVGVMLSYSVVPCQAVYALLLASGTAANDFDANEHIMFALAQLLRN